MNESTGAAYSAANDLPLAENVHVKELFNILQENGRDTSGLSALISHVSGMEDFVKRAEGRIADMKAQLDTMKEVQDHPIKTALQKTIKALETAVSQVKAQLSELKSNIIEGCKTAISEFKEKGAAVLDKLASFFKIKSGLQAIKNSTVKSASLCDKAVADIQTFSKQYHTAGNALRNMGRMMIGRKPIDAVKESGRLAKVFSAPYRAQKACMLGIRKQVDKIISALDKLEKSVDANRGERAAAKAKMPKLMERLEAKKNEIKQRELEKPPQERERAPRAQGHEAL